MQYNLQRKQWKMTQKNGGGGELGKMFGKGQLAHKTFKYICNTLGDKNKTFQ
jgi:hypothetical protein